MKLYKLISVIACNYVVSVNKEMNFVEEFDHTDISKAVKYREALVTSVYVLNEDTVVIDVKIS